jgi:large exoprotein involved in heme utilization and adhesion
MSKITRRAVGTPAGKSRHVMRRTTLSLLIAGCFAVQVAAPVRANPTGQQVVNGTATFTTQGNTLTITNTPGAIINWQSFSIGTDEATRFVQQTASSAVLNRVL